MSAPKIRPVMSPPICAACRCARSRQDEVVADEQDQAAQAGVTAKRGRENSPGRHRSARPPAEDRAGGSALTPTGPTTRCNCLPLRRSGRSLRSPLAKSDSHLAPRSPQHHMLKRMCMTPTCRKQRRPQAATIRLPVEWSGVGRPIRSTAGTWLQDEVPRRRAHRDERRHTNAENAWVTILGEDVPAASRARA